MLGGHFRSAVLCGALLGVGACATATGNGAHTAPSATVYDAPTQFSGEWLGEFGELAGTLTVKRLDEGRYYGMFQGDSEPVQYVLNMEQSRVVTGDASALGNRVLFSWQDGRGGRGEGWLLINREDTALTGEFGFAQALEGAGGLTFIRVR